MSQYTSNHLFGASQTGANERIFQENKMYTFKIYLFSFWNTDQTSVSIFFFEQTGEKFNLPKICFQRGSPTLMF